MANNATITWQNFTELTSLVNNVKSELERQGCFFHDMTVSNSSGIARNVSDIGVVGLVTKVTLKKNVKKIEFTISAADAKKGIDISNISSDKNCIVIATLQTKEDLEGVYAVTLYSTIQSPSDLLSGTIKLGYVSRTDATSEQTVTINILMIAFPNS